MSAEKVLLQEMKWPEVKELICAKPTVIIPTGSIEQHGPHLPLEVDSRIAKELAFASAQILRPEIPVVVAPGLDIGFSGEHLSFAGTLSLEAETFMRVASQVVLNLIGHGFEKFLFLNGHGGNEEALRLVARTLREKHEVLIAATSYWQLGREAIKALRQSPGSGINHGGEEETALMLAQFLFGGRLRSGSASCLRTPARRYRSARARWRSHDGYCRRGKENVRGDCGGNRAFRS